MNKKKFVLQNFFRDVCSPRPDCSGDQKFRTFDGTCNSLTSPLRGKSNICNISIDPLDYLIQTIQYVVHHQNCRIQKQSLPSPFASSLWGRRHPPQAFSPSLKIKVIVDFSTSRGVSSHVSHDQGYQSSLPSPRVISDTIMRFSSTSLSFPTSFTEQLALFYFFYESDSSPGRATRTRRRARRTPTW